LALAVGTGLSKHNAKRAGYRHGSEGGAVTLGGRRLRGQRPRVRATNASAELFLPSYALFSSTEVLGRLARERMLLGPLGAPLRGRPGAGWPSRAASPVPPRAPSMKLLARPLDDLDLVSAYAETCRFLYDETCRLRVRPCT